MDKFDLVSFVYAFGRSAYKRIPLCLPMIQLLYIKQRAICTEYISQTTLMLDRYQIQNRKYIVIGALCFSLFNCLLVFVCVDDI